MKQDFYSNAVNRFGQRNVDAFIDRYGVVPEQSSSSRTRRRHRSLLRSIDEEFEGQLREQNAQKERSRQADRVRRNALVSEKSKKGRRSTILTLGRRAGSLEPTEIRRASLLGYS
jgi:hypothetical protein